MRRIKWSDDFSPHDKPPSPLCPSPSLLPFCSHKTGHVWLPIKPWGCVKDKAQEEPLFLICTIWNKNSVTGKWHIKLLYICLKLKYTHTQYTVYLSLYLTSSIWYLHCLISKDHTLRTMLTVQTQALAEIIHGFQMKAISYISNLLVQSWDLFHMY